MTARETDEVAEVVNIMGARFVIGLVTLALAALTPRVHSEEASTVSVSPDFHTFFTQKVHPLLEAKCFGCHGEAKDREGEFDMRTREGLLKGGESGKPAIVPGDPERSSLLQAVLRKGKLKMPPKDRNKLSSEEIEVLRKWIAAGAVWGEERQKAT